MSAGTNLGTPVRATGPWSEVFWWMLAPRAGAALAAVPFFSIPVLAVVTAIWNTTSLFDQAEWVWPWFAVAGALLTTGTFFRVRRLPTFTRRWRFEFRTFSPITIGGSVTGLYHYGWTPTVLCVVLWLATLVRTPAPTNTNALIYGYDPVPDGELYREIEALPGVKLIHITTPAGATYDDHTTYTGTVFITRHADPRSTLDAAIRILRKGRPGAWTNIDVRDPRHNITTPEALGLRTVDDLTNRYGPQKDADAEPG